MTNPLLEPSQLPFDAVPFDRVRIEHYVPALAEAIREAKERVLRVKTDQAPPSLENTVVALEQATASVYDIAYIYSNLRSAHGDQAMHALAKEIMPKLIELESDINLDAVLFARVKDVYATLGQKSYTPEQHMLIEKTYRAFCRGGGLLDEAGKAKLRLIDEELSTLGPQFSENVLKATNSYELVVTRVEDLAGLPESAVEAAAQTAEERGRKGSWVFTLQAPSVMAFLKYADNRALRREIWTAYNSRALTGEYSNQELVRRIACLRGARARLLGFDSHAHYQMEERMAEHPARVREFLGRLLECSRPAALREVDELRQYMQSRGGGDELTAWDYAYWANKLKEATFELNAEELRPYFRLDDVLAGAFEHARRLYDLEFKPVAGVPVYAEGVQVFEVQSRSANESMGLLYTDFYPRATKAGGAWCTRFRSQWREGDRLVRPHVSIVCNFTKPTGTKPSLLTFQEVSTLFHEFGHGLHSLLSKCDYRSLSCTSVYRDFVELPSQIMENWIKEKESLALFARHYQTGELIPDALVDKIIASENFHAAYLRMRQLRFAKLDMAWYGGAADQSTDVQAFEAEAVRDTDVLPNVDGTNISCSFEHIFSGGYSAGYYGYKWAEVLDADAFELFKERGIFSRDVAGRFQKAILERGGSEHPMKLYKEFRGREPDPDALLRRSMLIQR